MSTLLDAAGDVLASATGMTPTQARGTLRLLLKERGIDARIARKADLFALCGAPLEEALAKRHLEPRPGVIGRLRRAIEDAEEPEDAMDLFSEID